MDYLEAAKGKLYRQKQEEHSTDLKQRIVVFQQNGSGHRKIHGIRQYGGDRVVLEVISIDQPLPPVLDDSQDYLPKEIDSDLVLDFLKHPDLSHDLGMLCRNKGIPLVASGKKLRIEGVLTPPT